MTASRFAAALLAATLLAAPAGGRADSAADTDFLFRLGMMEGHLIIGHDLLVAGHPGLAMPHFGHPVRELYDDVAEYVTAKHIAPFDKQLIRLEAAVAGSPKVAETEALYRATIETLHQARLATPKQLRDSVPDVIKVCADTIDAASGEYGEAVNGGKIDQLIEYHDSRGYLSLVAQQVASLAHTHADPVSQTMIRRFQAVLDKAQWIVAPLLPEAQPRASVAQYREVAAEAARVAGGP